MRRKKRRNRRSKEKHGFLSGITQTGGNDYVSTAKEGGLMLLVAIMAGGAGAALGKHSLLLGVPTTLVGIHRKNKFLIAAGLGFTLSNGFQKPGQTQSVQGVDGFDFKQIAANAKDRVGTFFQNFKEKLYLPNAPQSSSTEGLAGDEEQVSYFVNPYSKSGELDMSALDRVQEQIAEMNKNVSGLSDTEREF
jgi:hypothetical protein